jgi:hypothetical protein
VAVPLPRGRIEVLAGVAASWVLGEGIADAPTRFVGLTVTGTDVQAQQARLEAAGIACIHGPWGLVVPQAAGLGTAVVFLH